MIARYTAAFKDPHFAIFENENLAVLSGEIKQDRPTWPGIITGLRAGQTKVLYSETDKIPVGSTVASCDGRLPKEIVKNDLLPWVLDRADRPRQTLKSCLFNYDGRQTNIALEWRPIDEQDVSQLVERAQWGPVPDFSFSRTIDDVVWISLPIFYPNDDQRPILEDFINRLARNRQKILSSRAVVFDLRGNGGGSAAWATRIIEAFYGKAYFASHVLEEQYVADWRVSQGNLDNLKKSRTRIKAQNNQASLMWIDGVIEGMTRSLERGDIYFQEKGESPEEQVQNTTFNPIDIPVFFLTDGRCASACLNFADTLFQMGGAIHIGDYTYSDSAYVEARFVELSSGMSTLVTPTVVFRNRSRKSGQFFTPHFFFPGKEWTTPALQAWVNDLLENPRLLRKDENSTGETK